MYVLSNLSQLTRLKTRLRCIDTNYVFTMVPDVPGPMCSVRRMIVRCTENAAQRADNEALLWERLEEGEK